MLLLLNAHSDYTSKCVIYQYDGQNKIKTPLKRSLNCCELYTKNGTENY